MVAMVRCRAAKAWSGLDGVLQLRGWCDFDVVVIVAPVSGLPTTSNDTGNVCMQETWPRRKLRKISLSKGERVSTRVPVPHLIQRPVGHAPPTLGRQTPDHTIPSEGLQAESLTRYSFINTIPSSLNNLHQPSSLSNPQNSPTAPSDPPEVTPDTAPQMNHERPPVLFVGEPGGDTWQGMYFSLTWQLQRLVVGRGQFSARANQTTSETGVRAIWHGGEDQGTLLTFQHSCSLSGGRSEFACIEHVLACCLLQEVPSQAAAAEEML